MKLLSFFFLLIAIICLTISGNQLYKRFTPQQLSFTSLPTQTVSDIKTQVPVRLEIPTRDIRLPIFPAQIVNNTWETTDKGVSYVLSSPLPGEKGNSILYGHNFTNILGKLPQIKPGEKIIITFTNGQKRIFVADKTAIVTPTDASVLSSTNEATITIYTCTGFLDSKRFVVRAIPFS